MSTQEHITISSLPSEKDSKNYDFLREEGITYLQNAVGKIWTDYNPHDPGVTILEELCYALTDLAYRTNLDIADILAVNEDDDTAEDDFNFFTAREILTNAPYTINDYRKLLIDLEGIKNAWLDPTTRSEVDFYANFKKKEITYNKTGKAVKKIDLNGLYEVLLEFDACEEYGDLNDNTLITELVIKTGKLKGLVIEIEVEFPYWSFEWPAGMGWHNLENIKDRISCVTTRVKETPENFKVEVNVTADHIIQVQVSEGDGTAYVKKPLLAAKIRNGIKALFNTSGSGANNLLVRQQKKVIKTFKIVDSAKALVHENRNLCEDFVRFSALKIEEIVICADIELTTEVDTEEVLAEIYFLIGQFLAPDIHFYSFAEMLDKGKTTEEIFEGPRLDHGFIDTDELENSDRKKRIHVSDLINIIMDIEGVVAIKKIQIGNIPLGNSQIESKSVDWCLDLAWDKNFVPRLSISRSKIVFLKKGIPFIANADEVEELLEAKKEAYLDDYTEIPELDLPVPNGNYYRLEEYSSIQLDFPENYGVGAVGLPDSASELRKAQTKQTKAFLLFFDQFLANFCSQLANVKKLFSMNEVIDRTYFNQPLYEVPNIADLYKNFVEETGLTNNPKRDVQSLVETEWEKFREDENNTHRQLLDSIIEDQETFLSRRNAFLDHLLARFCEQFTDYAMLAYRLEGKKAGEELIEDKLTFLRNYPEISYNRGQGFNYLKPGWDSANVSGLQKRVSGLLGIENFTRRDLACKPPITYFQKFKDTDGKWRFRLKDYNGKIVLKSEAYNSPGGRTTGIKSVLNNGVSYDNYDLKKSADNKYYYNLVAQNGEIIGTSNLHKTEKARDRALEKTIQILSGDCSGEGMYFLEHILIRPRNKNKDDFLPVSFKEDCYCVGNEDAYSFRATCILPYWTGRFTNMDFRNFVEQTIREETPAHIFLKICWINQEQMAKFQKAYSEWLEVMENCPPDQTELTQKQNNLIAVLDTLRNVYPVSNLYDCQETDTSPVMLGQSILGTFIPKENE